VAQGATIAVYFNAGDEGGWLAVLKRAAFPGTGDQAPSVLSSSFFVCNGDDPIGQDVPTSFSMPPRSPVPAARRRKKASRPVSPAAHEALLLSGPCSVNTGCPGGPELRSSMWTATSWAAAQYRSCCVGPDLTAGAAGLCRA
jgi:hypothetical protein